MNYLHNLAPFAKAVTAFLALLVPVLATLAAVLTDISQGRLDVGDIGVFATALAALAAGTKAVYQVKNKGA